MAKTVKKAAKKAVKKKTPRKAAKKTTAKKVVAKKASVKKAPLKTSPKKLDWLPIALIILGIVIVVYALSSLFSHTDTVEPEVAATVNGVEITSRQLNTQYAILPEQYKQVYTKEIILQQLIDEQIILEYALTQGVEVTEEDINEEIQRILQTGQIGLVELQENLEIFNLTIDDFEDLIERKILIERGMASVLDEVPEPTQEAVAAYYEANNAEFVQEQQVRVRHILVASQRDNAAELGLDLKEQIETGADFCDLVNEYSDDKGSLQTCGEYTFGRGFMVPEFEKASFDIKPGDVTMVQTTFGYHIIEKLDDIPETILPLSEVEEQIAVALLNQARIESYQEFLDARKEEAEIVIN